MLLNLKEGEYLGRGLRAADNSFFKLSITTYQPLYKTEKHYHDNNYFSILLKGNYLEKNTAETNMVFAGDILFRPGSYTHENLFEKDGGTCFNIEFKPGWKDHFNGNIKLPGHFTQYQAGSFPSLLKLLVNFQNGYNEELALELIADWLFDINENIPDKNVQPWVEKVAMILQNELGCFHSLFSLSEKVFVHPVYLARYFKEKKGVTIGEYQLKMKLANAVSLLLNTSLSISDISYRNGFYDDPHLIRSFKAAYKISPYQFRLLAKKLS